MIFKKFVYSKFSDYTTPSPNRDSPEFDKLNQVRVVLSQHQQQGMFLAPHVAKNVSNNRVVHCCNNNNEDYVDNRLAMETAKQQHFNHAHGFRRHRDINYDEEQRKLALRRSESLDRKHVIRSTTFDKNSDFNKRVSSSFDSLDSPPSTPKPPVPPAPPASLYSASNSSSSHSDMAGLSRRVQGLRIVSLTPETSV